MILDSWFVAYSLHRDAAAFIDIETTQWNGPIAVLGIYRPKDGQCIQLVRGRNLTRQAVLRALKDMHLLVTFNGTKHDIPKLREEFPDVFSSWRITLDIFEVAQSLGTKCGLKALELQFDISRPSWMQKRRHVALDLWRRFRGGDPAALNALLEYNAHDAVNLFPLTEHLARICNARHTAPDFI